MAANIFSSASSHKSANVGIGEKFRTSSRVKVTGIFQRVLEVCDFLLGVAGSEISSPIAAF